MTHPVEPEAEDTHAVFYDLLTAADENGWLDTAEHDKYLHRYAEAIQVERRRREFDRAWDDSLWTATRAGQ